MWAWCWSSLLTSGKNAVLFFFVFSKMSNFSCRSPTECIYCNCCSYCSLIQPTGQAVSSQAVVMLTIVLLKVYWFKSGNQGEAGSQCSQMLQQLYLCRGRPNTWACQIDSAFTRHSAVSASVCPRLDFELLLFNLLTFCVECWRDSPGGDAAEYTALQPPLLAQILSSLLSSPHARSLFII